MKSLFSNNATGFRILLLLFGLPMSFAQYKGVEFRFNTGGAYKLSLPLEITSSRDNIDFNASLFSADGIGYFAFNQNISGRLRIGYRSMVLKANSENYDVSNYSYLLNGKLFNRSITVAPGITRNFTFDKLTFLTTAELPVTIVGDVKGELTIKEEDNTGILLDQKGTLRVDGGIAAGLNGVAGFRYNLYKGFSLGLDLNMGIQYYKVKGSGDLETFDNGTSTSFYKQPFSSRLISVTPLTGSLVVGMKF